MNCLSVAYRPVRELFTHIGTYPFRVILDYVWLLRPWKRDGFLSCHICYDTGPLFDHPLRQAARGDEDLCSTGLT